MKRFAAALSFLALVGASPQEPPSAADFLKAVQEKIRAAKTLRVEYTVTVKKGAAEEGTLQGLVLLGGEGRWRKDLELKLNRRTADEFSLSFLCDGRKVIAAKPAPESEFTKLKPEQAAAVIREGLTESFLPLFFDLQSRDQGGFRLGRPEFLDVKDGGKEKAGDVEGRVVEYSLKFKGGPFGDNGLPSRLIADPKSLRPLRRELNLGGVSWVEQYPTFALDVELADSEFVYQSLRRLAGARAAQLARSVELFERFTGRAPRSPEELVRRPADLDRDVFFPDGGFVLGSSVPGDPWGRPFEFKRDGGRTSVVCRGADGKPGGEGDDEDAVVTLKSAPTRQAVGAPTERLRRYYAARVQIHLLVAAVRAFQSTYGELPRKKASLWERQEWMTVWPEGGWLPAGRMPVDPWGDAYRMISEPEYVRVQTNDPKARRLLAKSLEAAERDALAAVAAPKLTEEEKREVASHFEDLSHDDPDRRDRAEAALKSMGLAALAPLEERLKVETNPEAQGRLASIRKSVPAPKPAWSEELGPLAVTVRSGAADFRGAMDANERYATMSLKTLATAEADFRANDRDNNHINDFWTGDVSGLYTVVPAGAKDPIKLIDLSVAAADGAPLDDGAAISRFVVRGPKAGYYFRAMTSDKSSGKSEPYQVDTGGMPSRGKVYNSSAFGFCAYPAEYGEGGRRTFIISEGNTIFWKDTEGEPALEWPSEKELVDGWRKID